MKGCRGRLSVQIPDIPQFLTVATLNLWHIFIPTANVGADEIEYPLKGRYESLRDIVLRVEAHVPSGSGCILSEYAYLFFNISSGGTTRSIKRAPGAPVLTTYGTRSPYCGSARGSSTIFRALIMAPGGGTPLSLAIVNTDESRHFTYTYQALLLLRNRNLG